MNDPITHTIVLIAAISLWLYGAFPFLRYTISAAEGRFEAKLILWFVLMILAIFFIKHALYSLTGWPQPGTWSARLFFGFGLFLSVPVPFIWDYIRQLMSKRKRD